MTLPTPEGERSGPPERQDLERIPGLVLLEFGTSWCGHCQALAPHIERSLALFPTVQHIKVEDGPGKPLGRSFRVKLWPTLILLKDGQVMRQLVRPAPEEFREGLRSLVQGGPVEEAPSDNP
ncbi:MAG: thioredoxin family protein [Isosphaeraceae bacterium]